jgi:hypothetical protein
MLPVLSFRADIALSCLTKEGLSTMSKHNKTWLTKGLELESASNLLAPILLLQLTSQGS